MGESTEDLDGDRALASAEEWFLRGSKDDFLARMGADCRSTDLEREDGVAWVVDDWLGG